MEGPLDVFVGGVIVQYVETRLYCLFLNCQEPLRDLTD